MKTNRIILFLIFLVAVGVGVWWWFGSGVRDKSTMTELEARSVAQSTCIKGGEALASGTYNANTKTWWFDANLNITRPGCSPACVVNEETETAEINWRCTGLLQEE